MIVAFSVYPYDPGYNLLCTYSQVVVLSVNSQEMVETSLNCTMVFSAATLSSDYQGEIKIKPVARIPDYSWTVLRPFNRAVLDSINLLHSPLIFSIISLVISVVFQDTLRESRGYHALNMKLW